MRLTEAIETYNKRVGEDYKYTHLSENEVRNIKWLRRIYKKNPWLRAKEQKRLWERIR